LILNSDIILTEGSLKKMLEHLKSNPKVGILGPKLLNFDGTPQASAFHFYTPLIILYRRTLLGKTPWGKKKLADFVINLESKTKPVSIDGWLMGSALMLRRDNLEKVGLMDERYFMYFEDVDWCRRFKEQGFDIVYFPKVTLFHYHGKQSTLRHFWEVIFNKFTVIHITSAIKYFWKFRKSNKI
jgi:N-acetylglucosaminyl-diphospho-decaprenol L-rhamnosyltransferase